MLLHRGPKSGAGPPKRAKSATPPTQEVRLQLGRILASKQFTNRERLKGFLRFVVEEALAGRGEQINEYLIGIEVFGKNDSFDPRLNPTVRVEAHRLRLQLEAYYSEEGADDPLRIEFPKGSYHPVWRWAEEGVPAMPKEELASAKHRLKWRWLAAGGALAAVAVAIYLVAVQHYSFLIPVATSALAPFQGRTPSVAVLPFLDLSEDKSLEHLCDGLTEELIASLAAAERLRVVSRTSVFVFKNRSEDVRRIGQLLNAEAVLEGSLRKTGKTLRVTTQLISTSNGYHLWSQSFESGSGDVFFLRDQIVRALCERLGIQPGRGRAGPAPDPQAYQSYLMGRYHWNKRRPANLRKAIAYFEEAIAADPSCSLAYVGLADTFCLLPAYGIAAPDEAMPKARTAALKALALAEDLAEAHASLAYVRSSYEWRWDEAEREFRRAIELSPGYATARHWYAGFLRAMGRFEEALQEIDRAHALDPLAPVISTDKGAIYRAMRRHRDAIRQYQKVIDFEPTFRTAYLNLGVDYAATGSYSEAVEAFEQARRLSQDIPADIAWLGYCYGRLGWIGKARDALAQLEITARERYAAPALFALVHLGLGDKERAIEWLEKACATHDSLLTGWLSVEPAFDPLRSDPRFHSLLRRIGLPAR